MADTLADFLLARIAEDEEAALAASAHPADRRPDTWTASRGRAVEPFGDEVSAGAAVVAKVAQGALHIARHDPARVLAECAAKRWLVSAHDDVHDCGWSDAFEWPYVGCQHLRQLALLYADHPDYRDEWRP